MTRRRHIQNAPEVNKRPWAKLQPITDELNTYPLTDDQILVGRGSDCKVQINEKRLSGKHCLVQRENDQIFLTDMSTNGTYINESTIKIGKGIRIQIHNETKIWLLPHCRVSRNQTIGFKLVLLNSTFKIQPTIPVPIIEERNESTEEKGIKFLTSIKQQIVCPFCCDIMIYPVSVQPCNHRLCGPCLTQLLQKKKEQCITCRKQMTSAVRDSLFSSIVDDYLRSHPEEKRKDEDEAPNIFGHQPVDIRSIFHGQQIQEQLDQNIKKQIVERTNNCILQPSNKESDPPTMINEHQETQNKKKSGKQSKKGAKKQTNEIKPRARKARGKSKSFISSDISASTDSQMQPQQISIVCAQCSKERNGFKCPPGQQHINCHNCSKPIAKRDEDNLNQKCALCDSYYCNLYLPPCQKNGPKLEFLYQRKKYCKLEPLSFRNNKVQMDAFNNLMITEKVTIGIVFDRILELAQIGRFEYILDKRIMRNPPLKERNIRIGKKTPVCDNCWRELWFQMLFLFRRQNGDSLPQTLRDRPPCYWGVNCKTMTHNLEHAKKFNHMQFQTRF